MAAVLRAAVARRHPAARLPPFIPGPPPLRRGHPDQRHVHARDGRRARGRPLGHGTQGPSRATDAGGDPRARAGPGAPPAPRPRPRTSPTGRDLGRPACSRPPGLGRGRVALRRVGELPGALQRAEVVLDAVVTERSRGVRGIDCHAADRIDRKRFAGARQLTGRLEELDRFGDVAQRSAPAGIQNDVSVRRNGTELAAIRCARRSGAGAVTRTSPPVAAAVTRAATLTVAPNQSPSRSTAGPV